MYLHYTQQEGQFPVAWPFGLISIFNFSQSTSFTGLKLIGHVTDQRTANLYPSFGYYLLKHGGNLTEATLTHLPFTIWLKFHTVDTTSVMAPYKAWGHTKCIKTKYTRHSPKPAHWLSLFAWYHSGTSEPLTLCPNFRRPTVQLSIRHKIPNYVFQPTGTPFGRQVQPICSLPG